MKMRSRKLAVFQSTLVPPEVYGDDEGDLLVVGWGSTEGAIIDAVDRARAEGRKVSTCQLTFLSPLEPGLKEIFSRFKQVMTVETTPIPRATRTSRTRPAAWASWPGCCVPTR